VALLQVSGNTAGRRRRFHGRAADARGRITAFEGKIDSNRDGSSMVEPDYSSYYWQDGAVRLRAMRQEDWEDHFRSRFDSVARRLLQYEIELPPTVASEKEMAATFCDFAQGSGRLMFVIETMDGIPVGGINLNSIDERHGTFSIGMQIFRNYRGKGYGTAAMRIVLRYAFLERRLNKYYGSVIEGNVASARMLTKLGCAEEGRRREMIYTDGQYRDEILFGMTKEAFMEAERRA
jgi:RimJ/RimL family protein N-acetyltransferase